AAAALASFALSIALTPTYPTSSFFLPHTRAWELLAGGLLAYLHTFANVAQHSPRAHTLSISGGLLIAAGLVLINFETAFPGGWALLPVSGTYLLIQAGPEGWLNKHVLANRFMIWVGLISYPLYL